MTIRKSQLNCELNSQIDASLLERKGNGITDMLEAFHEKHDVMYPWILLSATRETMRMYSCDMIPRITAAYSTPHLDRWGNCIFVELQYAKRGGRTIIAADILFAPDRPIVKRWTCYAD